ncbi:MAG: phage tail protein [Bryobacteraceae bacterium]|nr:phage tail protein [Bryobacteraceae bacterium]
MPDRSVPYTAFNFVVNVDTGESLGGFSDCTGLQTEITIAEYRNGNDKENHVRKVQGVHKVGDVTLKRGVINSSDFWAWVEDTRTKGPAAKREVVIVLRDEAGTPVQKWKLHKVIPLKYTGPNFAAKGGGDVAMEELVLSAEGLDFERA